jgi:hypothetical protein
MEPTATFGALIPIGSFIAYSLVFAITLNASQQTRMCFLPAILLLAGCSFWTMTLLTWPEGLSSLWGLGTIIHVFHSTSVLYIKRLSPSHASDCLPGFREGEVSTAFAIYKIWQDPQLLHRRPGRTTRWRRSRGKARMMFVGRKALRIVAWQTIQRQVASRIFPGLFAPLSLSDFKEPQDWWIRRLLSKDGSGAGLRREGLLRVAFTWYWLWAAFAMLDTANSVLAIGFVGTGLDEPEEWPACFGGLQEAYTVGRFWSRFWHQMATPAYSSHARALSQGLLGIREGSRANKTIRALIIFVLSGTTHAVCSWRLGDRCGWSGDVWFFATCFAAVGMERVVGSVIRRRGREKEAKEVKEVKEREEEGWQWRWLKWEIVAGYVWVFGFFVWAVPSWQYEKVYCGIQDVANQGKGGD